MSQGNGWLEGSWSKLGVILGYAMIAATVGVLLRILEERLGFLGRIVTNLLGVIWAAATFLVVPLLVHRDIGPWDAVKGSGRVSERHLGRKYHRERWNGVGIQSVVCAAGAGRRRLRSRAVFRRNGPGRHRGNRYRIFGVCRGGVGVAVALIEYTRRCRVFMELRLYRYATDSDRTMLSLASFQPIFWVMHSRQNENEPAVCHGQTERRYQSKSSGLIVL